MVPNAFLLRVPFRISILSNLSQDLGTEKQKKLEGGSFIFIGFHNVFSVSTYLLQTQFQLNLRCQNPPFWGSKNHSKSFRGRSGRTPKRCSKINLFFRCLLLFCQSKTNLQNSIKINIKPILSGSRRLRKYGPYVGNPGRGPGSISCRRSGSRTPWGRILEGPRSNLGCTWGGF